MAWSKCAMGGTCTSQQGSVVIDSNWRWLHTTDGYVNCYTGNEWDAALCPSNAEGGTYGATTNGDALTLKFVAEGEFSTNIGSRLYLLESESKYQGLTLLGNEFTFDVDVSNLDCGINGALYISSMDLDGGVRKFSSNTAGPKCGTGYCDSQCPRDVKFIDGEANVESWVASSNDANADIGNLGACCAEMDIWEANKDDKALANSESLITGVSGNPVTEDYCVAQRAAFGDNTSFMDKGGLATLSAALAKPMALVMSLWDDHAANMLWLDSTYPMDSTKLGGTRGSSATGSGVPADVKAEQVQLFTLTSSLAPSGPLSTQLASKIRGLPRLLLAAAPPQRHQYRPWKPVALRTELLVEERQHRELQRILLNWSWDKHVY
ncbi:hypothetical protein VE04_02177 [Pseudogymnoascus sp. 24MN13]|nr:hypothetical protein VE04_02177 [Pseudogymnoascus sp. 24MN13]